MEEAQTARSEPPAEEQVESYGITLQKKYGVIVAATQGASTIKIGQKVVSNGRFKAPRGAWGLVVNIREPFKNCSTDILEVWWENARGPTAMKFKDLEFS